ncbi:unnamed protein product [Caenorhabditis auriculariae]|uniref:Uncharacterized protein n=1 Tax=Caenorhabditis auriculariae TaxID=2777116 RepID=A0A8S1HQ62_9PELO|nr:unnamed protein product [Caenorhabditis auriculariae]
MHAECSREENLKKKFDSVEAEHEAFSLRSNRKVVFKERPDDRRVISVNQSCLLATLRCCHNLVDTSNQMITTVYFARLADIQKGRDIEQKKRWCEQKGVAPHNSQAADAKLSSVFS